MKTKLQFIDFGKKRNLAKHYNINILIVKYLICLVDIFGIDSLNKTKYNSSSTKFKEDV